MITFDHLSLLIELNNSMSFFICKTAKNIKILQKNGFKIAAKRSNSKNLDGINEIRVSKAK
tara:strand:+ start:382 stop:564 length:183 start_codon:yes stop_codon:yes gene_type:complete